jgi:hypothetical protein
MFAAMMSRFHFAKELQLGFPQGGKLNFGDGTPSLILAIGPLIKMDVSA